MFFLEISLHCTENVINQGTHCHLLSSISWKIGTSVDMVSFGLSGSLWFEEYILPNLGLPLNT